MWLRQWLRRSLRCRRCGCLNAARAVRSRRYRNHLQARFNFYGFATRTRSGKLLDSQLHFCHELALHGCAKSTGLLNNPVEIPARRLAPRPARLRMTPARPARPATATAPAPALRRTPPQATAPKPPTSWRWLVEVGCCEQAPLGYLGAEGWLLLITVKLTAPFRQAYGQ